MDTLAQDPRVGACVAAKVAQFAWGRAMTDGINACCRHPGAGERIARPHVRRSDHGRRTTPDFRYTGGQMSNLQQAKVTQ